MRTVTSRFAVVAVAVACACACAPSRSAAADTSDDRFASPAAWASGYPAHVGRTLRPLGDWQRDLVLGAGVSLALLAAAQADSTVERQVLDHGPLGHGLDSFGSDIAPWLLVGGYVAPALLGDRSTATRLADLEAMIEAQAAQGLLVEGLKKAVDRRRPNGNRYAFPSGHTSFAFTSAGLIDGRFGHAAGAAAFAAAGFVAATRITLGRHWLSDTVAGAALGASVGELVAAQHRRERHAASGEATAPCSPEWTAGVGTTSAGSAALVVRLSF